MNRWTSLAYDNNVANEPGLVIASGTQNYSYDGENRLKTATVVTTAAIGMSVSGY